MAGGGNDFIVLDGVNRPAPEFSPEEIRRLCRRGVSIGADGLVVLARSECAGVRMLHWNSDGGANPFCGNGTRCAARLAFELDLVPLKTTIETGSGVMDAELFVGGEVSVQVPRASGLRRGIGLEASGKLFEGDFVVIGVPHFVTMSAAPLSSLDLVAIGPPLRRHPDLGPAGANVSFVERHGADTLRIRTFERGVEGETGSCGSGSVAAALSLRLASGGDRPVRLLPTSGIPLTVTMRLEGGELTDFRLRGDARIVFRGEATPETEGPEGEGLGPSA